MQKPTPSALHQLGLSKHWASHCEAKQIDANDPMPMKSKEYNGYTNVGFTWRGRRRLHCPLRRWDTLVDTIRQADTAIPDSKRDKKIQDGLISMVLITAHG